MGCIRYVLLYLFIKCTNNKILYEIIENFGAIVYRKSSILSETTSSDQQLYSLFEYDGYVVGYDVVIFTINFLYKYFYN